MRTWKEIKKKSDKDLNLEEELDKILLAINKSRSKVFHLEAVANDRLYVRSEIQADSLEEAESLMKLVFFNYFVNADDVKIHCISENWLH